MIKIIFSSFLMLVMILWNGVSLADPGFGRLFTSPEERATLDDLRKSSKETTLNDNPALPEVKEMANLPQEVSMQGYVKRNDGKKGTVWINNQPVRENSVSEAITVGSIGRNTNAIPLKLEATGQRIKLKAGQRFLTQENRINDIASGGRNGSPESSLLKKEIP